MIRIEGLRLTRGAKVLLEGASLVVHAGHKVALVGANGSGKSSLLALLTGELVPDAGRAELPARWVLAHVRQDTPAPGRAALEFILDGDEELRAVEHELARIEGNAPHPPDDATGRRLAELHARFEEIGGHGARARAAALMHGLGFGPGEETRAVGELSGGWRRRLELARALMARSDLLLLDEPTNHLDLDAVLWLEDWLRLYPGTLLLVTHDRDFIDAVAGTVVHLERRQLRAYAGNYSAFERQRAAALAQQQAAHARQERTIAHMRAFVERFRAKATKARQAQSRLKALERMETIAAAHVDTPFAFAFRAPEGAPRQLLRLEHASAGYDDRAVLREIEWSLLPGQRIGLVGPNGAGKSTLLRLLVGELAPLSGAVHRGQGLAIGYFAQHQVEALRLEESPLAHLQRLDPQARDQDLRDFLGGFDFRGDMALSPVAPFSGGEKARLALALIVYRRPNLLLLDEPTNHLDIEMREALTEALQDYAGALVVVAHDRHLLRATTDELWLVADGRLQPFEGDLDDYKAWASAWRAGRRASARAADALAGTDSAGAPGVEAGGRRAARRSQAQARQALAALRRPIETRIGRLEPRIEALTREKSLIDGWLGTPEAYLDEARTRLQAELKRQAGLEREIARLEQEWLEAHAELERLRAEEGS